MSTYCNNYKKDDCDCYDKKRYDGYDKKHDQYDYDKKKDCRAILECGKTFDQTLPQVFFNALGANPTGEPIKLAEVTVDARELCVPCVKIEYSSIIDVPNDPNVLLTFRLVRKCKGEDDETTLRTWQFLRRADGSANVETRDSFTVAFCQCLDCCEQAKCCTYTMQLVAASQVNNLTNDPSTYTISEKDISAIAACSACRQ